MSRARLVYSQVTNAWTFAAPTRGTSSPRGGPRRRGASSLRPVRPVPRHCWGQAIFQRLQGRPEAAGGGGRLISLEPPAMAKPYFPSIDFENVGETWEWAAG